MEILLDKIKIKKYEKSSLIYIPLSDYKLWVPNKLIKSLSHGMKLLWCGRDECTYTFNIFKGHYSAKKYIKTEERTISAKELCDMLDIKEKTHVPEYIEPTYNQEALDELKY